MDCSTIINTVGLAFDIIGVVLLFFYEPPKEFHGMLWQNAPPKEETERKNKIKGRNSKLALVLLIIGFLFQIVSNFV